MIKNSVYILLLIGVVVTLVFAIINRKATHTLLPIQPKVQSVEITTEPDSIVVEADSIVVDTIPELQ